MSSLDFNELAKLINHSRTTEISLEAIREKPARWSLHQGRHKVHTSSYPFTVLYFNAAASKDDINSARTVLSNGTMTHVVYPESFIGAKQPSLLKSLSSSSDGHIDFWTIKNYIRSFIKDELNVYLQQLISQQPTYYVDPRVETPSTIVRKVPNPLFNFLNDPASPSGTNNGRVAVLLAEPGQGKTYMSRHLVAELAKRRLGALPLMVDSSQWNTLSIDDLRSLSKTIAHSFRHFDATIGWIEGHEEEFLRTTLKADIFRLVFDGFDEYILRNRGTVTALDVLETLAELAHDTGSRIIVTSRTSFWETSIPKQELDSFLQDTATLAYTIEPFTAEQSSQYFERRLPNESHRRSATRHFKALYAQNAKLVGRGFVLNLIADVAERTTAAVKDEVCPSGELLSLVHSLCERELLRQDLSFSAIEQIEMLRSLRAEIAMGVGPTTEILELVMQDAKPSLDPDSLRSTIDKFKSHPLLKWEKESDRWSFKETQVGVLLLSSQILQWEKEKAKKFCTAAKLDETEVQDVGQAIVDMIVSQESPDARMVRLRECCECLSAGTVESFVSSDAGPRLAATIALAAVERIYPKGSSREERAAALKKLCGDDAVKGMTFSGIIASYDFTHIGFKNCRFDHVTWANCQFSKSTVLANCHLHGGSPPLHCQDFGAITLTDCRLDVEAEAVLSHARVKAGTKRYSVRDLDNDVRAVLNKFIVKGSLGLKTVSEANLGKGAISSSRHQGEVVARLSEYVLERHEISGGHVGFNVRPDAADAMRFYAGNNVLIGPLRRAFDRLVQELGLGERSS